MNFGDKIILIFNRVVLTKNSSRISTRFHHFKTKNLALEQKMGLCEWGVKFNFGNWSSTDPHNKFFIEFFSVPSPKTGILAYTLEEQ